MKFFAILALLLTASIASAQQPAALARSTELIVVTTPDWNSVAASLQRYDRPTPHAQWQPVGSPVTVDLGRSGIAWGMGLTPIPATRTSADPVKKEGDGRSPAGIFPLTAAFGYAYPQDPAWKMPYLYLAPTVECVDDAKSIFYNMVVDRTSVTPDWHSSEQMHIDDYQIGLVIGHNAKPIKPGGGSCIFMHIWEGAGVGTSGCTAMPREQLEPIIVWLDPAKNPLLVQLPIAQYNKLKNSWHLPALIVK
jgi:D-alanyl-D-alanine dipeptidase